MVAGYGKERVDSEDAVRGSVDVAVEPKYRTIFIHQLEL